MSLAVNEKQSPNMEHLQAVLRYDCLLAVGLGDVWRAECHKCLALDACTAAWETTG